MSDRKPWTPADVVDVAGPPALLRNYLEQRDVMSYLHKAAAHTPIHRAYDIGSGFGRLTPVLCEAAAEVVGFEREASLVATAKSLRLKQTAGPTEVELDLRDDGGRARSAFLHRLAALRLPWATKLDAGRTRGTFKEKWSLQWRPSPVRC